MSYPYAVTPYIQSAMAHAMQAVLSGGPLPPNCFVVAIPMQQAQQLFPQVAMNFAANGGAGVMMFAQQSSFYGIPYSTNPPYSENIPNNAIVPYKNHPPPNYNTTYNYPVVPYTGDYDNKSKKKTRQSRKKTIQPHSNVYNSSSFDSYMRHLSWSRLFERHHNKEQTTKDQAALSYDQKSTSSKKQRSHSQNSSTLSSLTSSSSSSSTTSDETIRRVDVSTKQSNGTSTSTKQQTKSSLPFKYSSEFVPSTGKEQTSKPKKESKVKIDDVFVIKKPPSTPPSTSQ